MANVMQADAGGGSIQGYINNLGTNISELTALHGKLDTSVFNDSSNSVTALKNKLANAINTLTRAQVELQKYEDNRKKYKC